MTRFGRDSARSRKPGVHFRVVQVRVEQFLGRISDPCSALVECVKDSSRSLGETRQLGLHYVPEDLVRSMTPPPLCAAGFERSSRAKERKVGIEISEATVSKYLPRRSKPPSQTWRSFLENHVGTLMSVDFFTVPTVFFHVLFVFIVLAHVRIRRVHWDCRTQSEVTHQGARVPEEFLETHTQQLTAGWSGSARPEPA